MILSRIHLASRVFSGGNAGKTLTLERYETLASGVNVCLTVDCLQCVVLRSNVFERVPKIIGADWTRDEMRVALARSSEANG